MDTDQRKVTLHTADKVYSGFIDIGNSSLRTIDIFNSANLYWKNPAEKSFDDALLLRQASILLQGNVKFGEFDMLQLSKTHATERQKVSSPCGREKTFFRGGIINVHSIPHCGMLCTIKVHSMLLIYSG